MPLVILKVKVKVAQLCWALCEPTYCNLPGSSVHGILQTRILEWIIPTQRSNPCLPHCRYILYHLRHQGSPRILGWVAYPFFRGSSWPRNQTGVSCIAGRFFSSWASLLTNIICPNSYIKTRKGHEDWKEEIKLYFWMK